MSSRLVEIFEDEKLVEKIKRCLPYLFQQTKELYCEKGSKTCVGRKSREESVARAAEGFWTPFGLQL